MKKQQRKPQPEKRSRKSIILITLAVVLTACCGFGALASLLGGGDTARTDPTPVVETALQLEKQVQEVSAPPEASAPTDAPPIPTATPAPVDTPTPAPSPTAAAALPAPAQPTANVPAGAVVAQLARVVDGDTIDVVIDGQPATVRYVGIDTPENNSEIGVQAASANTDLLGDQVIYLLSDTTDRDQYGRLLRYVYLSDGRMVNEQLVLQGHALSVAYPPDTAYQTEFDAAQQEAQANRVGMWQTLSWAARSANIRNGPGTDYDIVDGAQPGEMLDIAARNSGGDWFKLGTGGWIFAQLVANPPSNLAVLAAPARPTATPIPQRSNPPAAAPRPAAVCQCSGIDYDCGNFGSWSSAQACFQYCLETVGYDVHRLDRDNDGIACESLR